MAPLGDATVLHVDMDAFFAAAEVRRRPELAGLAVIVGGTGDRGVVAAASYEARRFGVHSAMPTVRARRLCPQGVFLAGDHAYYREVSGRIMELFRSFTPLVEALSLDEAFLDVAGARRLFGPPGDIARRIRADLQSSEGLACSVGVGSNKLLAKLASRAAKPRAGPAGIEPGPGTVVIEPHDALCFLHRLPVGALWGVGPATLRRLSDMGVETVGDLAATPTDTLVAAFGRAHGHRLAELSQARDPQPVVASRTPKSLSVEVTFPRDVTDRAALEQEIVRQADSLGSRLRSAGCTTRTVVLKLRFGDFRTVTRSRRLREATAHAPHLARTAKELLALLDVAAGVRLLGLGAGGLLGDGSIQMRLEEAASAPPSALDEALDDLRARFGPQVIAPASTRPSGAHRSPPGRSERVS
ncbi:MAG: DNA polymerase IV [Acidimicrobiia bacterium]|nr:DNA polymerase IV [Acidimicrobiia bacterium]